jgi:hypothetical protein
MINYTHHEYNLQQMQMFPTYNARWRDTTVQIPQPDLNQTRLRDKRCEVKS